MMETWNDVLSCSETDTAYGLFWNIFSAHFNRCIPKTKQNINKRKPQNPRITKGIFWSIKKRNILYKRSLRHPSNENKYEYNCYRNKLTTIMRLENNIASDIRLSRNVVNKESKRSRRFVRCCNTSSGDNN